MLHISSAALWLAKRKVGYLADGKKKLFFVKVDETRIKPAKDSSGFVSLKFI